MDYRENAGYIITNAITVGESEIVLGVSKNKQDGFVTWECSRRTDYYWGHYFSDEMAAIKDFCKRGYDKARLYEQMRCNPKETEMSR